MYSRKDEQVVGKTQFAFWKGLGTREASLSCYKDASKSTKMPTYVSLSTIMAFDKPQHEYFIRLFEQNTDYRDIRIISNLNYEQKAKVTDKTETCEESEIIRRVR